MFLALVESMGGIARVVRSVDEARAVIEEACQLGEQSEKRSQ
jgi:hypothetical protein